MIGTALYEDIIIHLQKKIGKKEAFLTTASPEISENTIVKHPEGMAVIYGLDEDPIGNYQGIKHRFGITIYAKGQKRLEELSYKIFVQMGWYIPPPNVAADKGFIPAEGYCSFGGDRLLAVRKDGIWVKSHNYHLLLRYFSPENI